MKERDQREGSAKGPPPENPEEKEGFGKPEPDEQISLTDADSAIMRKSKRSEYRQAYNAQAVVDADGSQLIVGAEVSQCASDRGERAQGYRQYSRRTWQAVRCARRQWLCQWRRGQKS